MGMQISMIHIKSGIQCLILFQNSCKIVESVEMIKRFADDPLCKINLFSMQARKNRCHLINWFILQVNFWSYSFELGKWLWSGWISLVLNSIHIPFQFLWYFSCKWHKNIQQLTRLQWMCAQQAQILMFWRNFSLSMELAIKYGIMWSAHTLEGGKSADFSPSKHLSHRHRNGTLF